MYPPLPRPPLFPYTTLFRSGGSLLPRGYEVDKVAVEATILRQLGVKGKSHDGPLAHGDDPSIVEPGQNVDAVDRKSTRLNSSHITISYAVFCLKKKRKGNRQ